MKIPNVTIQQLLEAGVHLGHKTLRWNPKMKKYIFGKRDSIHIIDLTQTLELTKVALQKVYETISSDEDKIKRINVRKITSLKELFNSPIKEITINLSSKSQLKEIQSFLDEKGDTLVNIHILENTKKSTYKLKSLRNFDRKTVNILRNREIELNIQ